MTGKAFMTMFYATGDKTWLDYTIRANRFYLEKMRWNSPEHPFYGYFMDKQLKENNASVFSGLNPITLNRCWLNTH